MRVIGGAVCITARVGPGAQHFVIAVGGVGVMGTEDKVREKK